jgi:PAS domain S-box-containing protein
MVSEKSSILYIDDDQLNLDIFYEFFKEHYNIITLLSTSRAEEVLKNNQIKVLISDQCMPDETGIDFIKRINSSFPDIKKIILTAYSSQETALEAINNAGVYKYLLKPWRQEEVKETIDNSIREYDLQLEKRALLIELQAKNDVIAEAYNRLEANEKKFRALFYNSSDSKYILNHNNEITEANQAFLDLIGYTENVILNLKHLNFFVREHFAFLVENYFELVGSQKKAISNFEITKDGGDSKYIEVNSNHITYNNKNYVLSTIRDISERRMFEKKIVDTIIQTQEEFQSKYARELHDGLGPLLSTLKMHIQWISNPDNSLNKEKIIEHAIQTIDKSIRSVKEIANDLSPHILQRFGLVNAVNAYIDHVRETLKNEFFVSSNLKNRLNPTIELSLYRIILECINNSIKHAQAKKIIVKFNKRPDQLQIHISDNGIGFDVNKEMAKGEGMGLFNIQNRIKHIDGDIKIISNPSIGTDITISLNVT